MKLFLILYFLPTICTIGKKKPFEVIFINLLFGWTIIGWVWSFAEACTLKRTWPKFK